MISGEALTQHGGICRPPSHERRALRGTSPGQHNTCPARVEGTAPYMALPASPSQLLLRPLLLLRLLVPKDSLDPSPTHHGRGGAHHASHGDRTCTTLTTPHTWRLGRHAQDCQLTGATRGTGGELSQVETGPQLACNGSRLTARTTHTILAWLVVARWPTSRCLPSRPAPPPLARATLADSFTPLRTFRIVCLRLSLFPHPRLWPPRTTQLVRTDAALPSYC